MESQRYEGIHVAIIMDGNGRWALQRRLPRVAGHRAGISTVRRVVQRALHWDIGRLTLYAFSSDNWRRPASEVRSIFRLLRTFLRLETHALRENGVRLQIIGRRDRLDRRVLRAIESAEQLTAEGGRLHLCIAIDYSSRDAITRAAAGVLSALPDRSPLSSDMVQELLARYLGSETSNVDLLIRTGGEKRLSDFLLWESAYAELLFTDRMWPEFDQHDFDSALEEFSRRERRFGGVVNFAAEPAAVMS